MEQTNNQMPEGINLDTAYLVPSRSSEINPIKDTYIKIADIALIVYKDGEPITDSITINDKKTLLKLFNNTYFINPVDIKDMSTSIDIEFKMIAVTSTAAKNGAVAVFDYRTLDNICQMCDSKRLIFLCTSKHEAVVHPVSVLNRLGVGDLEEALRSVKQITSEEDWLSMTVFGYDSEFKQYAILLRKEF